ncbi:unnamed protein product [Mytilus coruscus]|uniref:Uncharacterized protein n=1 Tax=Mytilus coruscus TaxID=42192 RepID=A0A6J8ART0_MYTCO|nr:unnamed protein product [Mytilus coruscus]
MSSNSSSYSMSLSDSEFPEEPPSTRGCSSDFAYSTTQKDKRKERLKQYLRQLKQIINPEGKSGAHVSTLGALRHVLNSIQKNKNDDLQILVSTIGMKIVQVLPSLKKILGYPVPVVDEAKSMALNIVEEATQEVSVLVSEKEDMVPSPFCQTEETVEETSHKAQIIIPAIQEPSVLIHVIDTGDTSKTYKTTGKDVFRIGKTRY